MKTTSPLARVLVFPGGPGMSPSYLHPALDTVLDGLSVSYIDVAAPKTWADCLAKAVKQTEKFAPTAQDIILTHSWGSFLAFEVMRKVKLPCRFVLANPLPLTSALMPEIVLNFRSRLTDSELYRLSDILETQSGRKAGNIMLSLMMPAYCGRTRGKMPELEFDYWPEREAAISKETLKYQHVALFKAIERRSLVLFGEKDYIQPEHFGYAPENNHVLPGGHFAYAEKTAAWKKAIRAFIAGKA